MTEYYLNEEARRAKKILKARGVNISYIVQNALIKEAGIKEETNPFKDQIKALKQKSKSWEQEHKQSTIDSFLKMRKEYAIEFRRLCNVEYHDNKYEDLKPLLKIIKKRLTRDLTVKIQEKDIDPYTWWLEHYDKI